MLPTKAFAGTVLSVLDHKLGKMFRKPIIMRMELLKFALLLAAVCGSQGCIHPVSLDPTQWIGPNKTLGLKGVEGNDAIIVCLAVVERPVNEPYIHSAVWEMVDEQVIPFESKVRLAENGIRSGVLGGQPPQAFLDILGSDRSCVNPRQIQTRFGQPVIATIGSTRDEISYRLKSANESEDWQQTKATCQWEVIVGPGEPGRLKVFLCPLVKHGETQMKPRAVQDKSGILTWQLQSQQQIERHVTGQFEVETRPGEFILVGASGENHKTLGNAWFRQTDPHGSVQRMLVIRTARKSADSTIGNSQPDGPRPLALLAQDTH